MLKAGFEQENATASITILQLYHGLHPPSPDTPGCPDYIHVYGQFAFKQPTPMVAFDPINTTDRHGGWCNGSGNDVRSFVQVIGYA